MGRVLRCVKVPSKVAERILEEPEMKGLFAAAPAGRDRAFLRLMYYTGARVSELVKLRWLDLAQPGRMTVLGKGSKVRTLVVPQVVLDEVRDLKPQGVPLTDKLFIPVDCGSLVPTLIESELFGYVRGAFTGANQAKDGLLAIAEGGTIFLDEVGELPVDLQSKLLRAIQEKEIRPVGSTRRVPINVRILAATNRDLEQAVTEGAFRRDLYFRLNVLSLRIPPLRERREDIPLLIAHFMERASRASAQERTLNDEALKVLLAYDWPGNVRELENCLERTCAFTSGPVIHVPDLPPAIASTAITVAVPGNGHSQNKIVPMALLEKQTILSAIAELNGDKLQAARLLGIGKTTLYRKLKDYAAQA